MVFWNAIEDGLKETVFKQKVGYFKQGGKGINLTQQFEKTACKTLNFDIYSIMCFCRCVRCGMRF